MSDHRAPDNVTVSEVAAAIDDTLLAVVATDANVVALCVDANRFDVAAVGSRPALGTPSSRTSRSFEPAPRPTSS